MSSSYTTAGMPKNVYKLKSKQTYKVRVTVMGTAYVIGMFDTVAIAVTERDKFKALPIEEQIRLAKFKLTPEQPKPQPLAELKGTPFYGL